MPFHKHFFPSYLDHSKRERDRMCTELRQDPGYRDDALCRTLLQMIRTGTLVYDGGKIRLVNPKG